MMAKIMLVEDDNNLREIYEARLQAEGYQIVAAKDGEEALVVAKSQKPDLIISDIMMPKISGFEMLDILRNTDGLKDVKVIMLTALGQSDDQQKADRLGADRYLVKSQVTLEDIVKVTRELLGDTTAATPAAPAVSAPAPPSPALPVPTPQPASVAAVPSPAPAPAPAPDPAPPTVQPEPPAVTLAAAEPVMTPSSDTASAAVTADSAQSTDQEEAAVENQVENFVAGATDEPTPPEAAPPAEPAPPPPAETPPQPGNESVVRPTTAPPVDPAVTAADDKLVADAAQALATSAGDTNANTEWSGDATKSPSDLRTKRVIQPINTGPKTDINTLLAVEEARTAQAAPPSPVIVADDPKAKPGSVPPNPVIAPPPGAASPEPAIVPAVQSPLPQNEPPTDPNSIAL
jgi:CheY-like chemotaxis protein